MDTILLSLIGVVIGASISALVAIFIIESNNKHQLELKKLDIKVSNGNNARELWK
jgi:hypothetical protein